MPVEVVLHKILDDYAIQEYNQNFYAFINNYRVHELERIIHENKLEFRTWLFDSKAYPDSAQIQFLSVLRIIIRVTYLVQVVMTVIGNFLLISKYGSKAEQFYSEVLDGKYNNAKMLNYSIILMSLGAFTLTTLGRHFLLSKDVVICLGWLVFTIMLFIIGYMGIRQKPINPTFDLENIYPNNKSIELTSAAQKKIHL